jgi:hypothetical protein
VLAEDDIYLTEDLIFFQQCPYQYRLTKEWGFLPGLSPDLGFGNVLASRYHAMEPTIEWGKHRHVKKGHKWIAHRYWHSEGNRNWVFSARVFKLRKFSETTIRRHVMVKLDANLYLDKKYFLRKVRKMNKETDIKLKLTFFS